MPPKQKPTTAFDERKKRSSEDDPQRERRQDELNPEASGSAKWIEVEDLNATNDL
jgi:hypothetical protein